MSELARPLCPGARYLARMAQVERVRATQNLLDLQLRQLLNSLVLEDTSFGERKFVGDDVALHLGESPGTADRLMLDAQVFCEFPAVMAKVADSGWSMRHADAVLDEIVGIDLTREQQDQVVALVTEHPEARTPHQLRKATRAAVILADPEAAARRFEKIKKNRSVGSEETVQGGAGFWVNGTKSQIAMINASIEALLGPAQPGETRTLAQRRFDIFMDLICGRVVPGQWQALVVVTLATLEGEDVPAEIPGLGLITAEEAREVLAQAELRRVVVDQNGEIVSIDTTVERPDAPTDVPAERLLSHETEPHVDDAIDDQPSAEELAWLHAQTQAPHQPEAWTAHVPKQRRTITSTLEADLRRFLAAHTLTPSAAGRPDLRWIIGAEGPFTHGSGNDPPDDPPGPPHNPEPPNDPPNEPEPEPPTFDDLDWHDSTLDRESADAALPWPQPIREARMPGTTPSPHPGWTLTGLQHALDRLLTRRIDWTPLTSTAYALPPRMARFVKTRDHTCTFPGCYKLAQTCQNDHVIPWPTGPTAPHNTYSECTHHHQAKGAYFHVTRTPDGTLHWTTPSGKTVTRGPRPLLRGW